MLSCKPGSLNLPILLVLSTAINCKPGGGGGLLCQEVYFSKYMYNNCWKWIFYKVCTDFVFVVNRIKKHLEELTQSDTFTMVLISALTIRPR